MINLINQDYLVDVLRHLLDIPSPTGMTDDIVRTVCDELDALAIPYELTRRGAIRAHLCGTRKKPRRAVVAHLDTLGGMVSRLKENGRLAVVPVGTWSARFAEGARVIIHCDGDRTYQGTVLPLKASGHRYNQEVDQQPTAWSNLEIRVDERCSSVESLWDLGFRVGDYVSFTTTLDISTSGFINARFLDDKAGVAAILAAVKALHDHAVPVELDCSLLFTISEEVGVGASHVLRGNVAEMISVDNGIVAPGQNSSEFGVTIAMQDSSGPYDRHLTRHLIRLCMQQEIQFSRDIFLHYHSDAAAALEAGNDIRTALVCFALDASHGYERTHLQSLTSVAGLIAAYLNSAPLFSQDKNVIGPEATYPLICNPAEESPPDGSID